MAAVVTDKVPMSRNSVLDKTVRESVVVSPVKPCDSPQGEDAHTELCHQQQLPPTPFSCTVNLKVKVLKNPSRR